MREVRCDGLFGLEPAKKDFFENIEEILLRINRAGWAPIDTLAFVSCLLLTFLMIRIMPQICAKRDTTPENL